MKVTATRNFEKSLKECPLPIQRRANDVYQKLLACKKISDVVSLEKLSGYKTYYRVRIGTYRMGFELVGDEIELRTIIHRKEIYRFFP